MKASIIFNPQDVTYGFLFEVARYTTDAETLYKIWVIISFYDITGNLKKHCSQLGDNFEGNEKLQSSDWDRVIKAEIVNNEHSSYMLHKKLINDNSSRVRENTARMTRFEKLITYYCKHSGDRFKLMGFLRNPNLNAKQFDTIFNRLKNELARQFFVESARDRENFFEDYLFKSPFISKEQKAEMSDLLKRYSEEYISMGIC